MLKKGKRGLFQYQDVGLQTSITEANPHRLVQLLFENAIANIQKAKGAMQNGEIAIKGTAISQTISIVGTLRSTLNFEQGGDLAERLDALYEYIIRRLMAANRENSVEALQECLDLIRPVKEGWDQIPQQLKSAKS
ncbi:MAG TPA: flagellar export chaperone FliS [Gammaproteobacteria bacterium]|jgi:flagellar protein FliS|nr:flagellar export chaperone FliS [Gammaproteobacteria bacterium]MBT6878429.1 flagellar export chaperone FliS [Gammaproteobacteria bacterium]MBT7141058.1 flagellar export chaperone FliS [Gammaproteobacteria bacterium]HIJ23704.1 flagellar export chaperone FliS [Gammaproteobacteria bacterium]HIJ27727.1 flagellar export chaperone FliS [Gammaproteobacteria bacterium]